MSGNRGEKETARPLLRLFYLATIGIVVLDQISKYAAVRFLGDGNSVPVLDQVFHLTLVYNTGIAFGFFQSHPQILKMLISISIIILFWIGRRMVTESGGHAGGSFQPLRLNHWGIILITGGAIGNWIDRMRLGAVVDFLDFRIWPVFNIADTMISIGIGLYFIQLISSRGHHPDQHRETA